MLISEVDQYIRDKIASHKPALELVDSHFHINRDAKVYHIAKAESDRLNSVALSMSGLDLIKNEGKSLKDLVDYRFRTAMEVLFGVKK